MGCWAEVQAALGKGQEGGWLRACLAHVLPSPLLLLEDTGGYRESGSSYWSAAFLLGTLGVLISWFGIFLFFFFLNFFPLSQ